jgi:predicted RNA-binding Zn-ribbon protein involved in translation (DUF1610 family)
VTDAPAHCANCGQHFGAAAPAFCPACGQESRVRAPTLREFLQQFGGAYFSTEGALWRSLKLLVLQPGELTRQYLAGRRKHYVLPLRLYLTVSLVAILLLRLVAGADINLGLPKNLDLRKGEYSLLRFDDNVGAGLKDGVFYCKGMPAWFCKRLERRLAVDPKGLQREVEEFSGRYISNLGAAMFLMVPLFALFHKLVYWNRRLRYTEHLVFALHLHAVWFLCLLLTLLPWEGLAGLVALLVPWYGLASLKRVYGGRWFWRWSRAALVSLVYGIALGIVLGLAIVWALLF